MPTLLRNPDVASPLRKVILVASTLYLSEHVPNPDLQAALILLVAGLLQVWSKLDDNAIRKETP